jgi:hypothetical protein
MAAQSKPMAAQSQSQPSAAKRPAAPSKRPAKKKKPNPAKVVPTKSGPSAQKGTSRRACVQTEEEIEAEEADAIVIDVPSGSEGSVEESVEENAEDELGMPRIPSN